MTQKDYREQAKAEVIEEMQQEKTSRRKKRIRTDMMNADKMAFDETRLKSRMRVQILKKMATTTDGQEWSVDELYKMSATLEKLDKKSPADLYAEALFEFNKWLMQRNISSADLSIEFVTKVGELTSEYMQSRFNVKV